MSFACGFKSSAINGRLCQSLDCLSVCSLKLRVQGEEVADGLRFSVWTPAGVPRGMPVVYRLRRGIVTNGTK